MSETKRKIKSFLRIILLIVISLTIGIRLYGWNAQKLAGNAMPMPFGVGLSVVLSGSMEPTLSVNDLVVVHEADSYAVGDVVVYQDGSSLVVHRIISIDGDEIITQGDANNKADEPITASAVKGKMALRIPFVGALIQFIKTKVGFLLIIIATIALFEVPHLRERKKAADEQEKIKEEIRKLKGE